MTVTLGLCAFRLGMLWEAHCCLTDICSSRVKELLAQGVQRVRWNERDPEKEKMERRRQLPFHMHINVDLLECCHLTAAMLLEVRRIATETSAVDSFSRRPVSRHFR